MEWLASPAALAKVFKRYQTDKSSQFHSYEHIYHRFLAPIARRACCGNGTDGSAESAHRGRSGVVRTAASPPRLKLRMLEIGLGCGNHFMPAGTGGFLGLRGGEAGGSANAWRALLPPPLELELHVMEYDTKCAHAWATHHPGLAHVHTGDQSSAADLARVVAEAGGPGFDVIIDDGSHFNEHQIATAKQLVKAVAPGGVYVIEDIQSSCKNWIANQGERTDRAHTVGGTVQCMQTTKGGLTILAQLVEWQKGLIMRKPPFPGVRHIDIWEQVAAIEIEL